MPLSPSPLSQGRQHAAEPLPPLSQGTQSGSAAEVRGQEASGGGAGGGGDQSACPRHQDLLSVSLQLLGLSKARDCTCRKLV